ncbi:hypothetical protein H4W32_004178 [Actinophytocola algeriensis]|jgi:hypothetical protein|uniref:Uncharacterized protein n=1 Tax=Actinophytocola algeriensis TaxID=1768010 RepID=A0A7W7Q106_9PSEU|nr:hypothetical protein [Actinophytocola algeriensis]MBE1476136.1 hypothetical protein [Actinophytocola algeriensis]
MRMPSSRVAGLAVLATISALLLGGCQLREGAGSEYGDPQGMWKTAGLHEMGKN